MDDPDILDAIDRRLDPLVPTAPAPTADLVRRGRARLVRRRGLGLGLVAAVAVAAVAVTTSVVGSGGADVGGGPSTSTAAPSPAGPTTAGTSDAVLQVVAYGAVMFDVPASWVEAAGDCSVSNPGEQEPLVVEAPGQKTRCELRTSVQAFDLDSALGRSALRQATRATTRNGVSIRIGSSCPPTAACIFPSGRHVVVPEAGVGLLVNGPEGSQAVLDGVIDSIRLDEAAPPAILPDGYRLVGLDSVAVAVPEEWVSCPVYTGLSFGPPDADGGCSSPGGALDVVTLSRVPDVDDQPIYTEQGGLSLSISDGCGPAASCVNPVNSTVLAPDERVSILVGSSSGSLVTTIVGSVRAMPSGRVAVPPLDLPDRPVDVCRDLAANGLLTGGDAGSAGRCRDLRDGDVVAVSPGVGSVVPRRSTVSLTTADG